MNYPKKFDKCPCCGSTKTIIAEETEEQIVLGKLPEGSRIPALVTQSQIINMQDKKLIIARRSFPMILGFCDICSDCGTLYCVEVQRATGIIEPRVGGSPSGGNTSEPQFPFGKG